MFGTYDSGAFNRAFMTWERQERSNQLYELLDRKHSPDNKAESTRKAVTLNLKEENDNHSCKKAARAALTNSARRTLF
jgi:hypothetical protein